MYKPSGVLRLPLYVTYWFSRLRYSDDNCVEVTSLAGMRKKHVGLLLCDAHGCCDIHAVSVLASGDNARENIHNIRMPELHQMPGDAVIVCDRAMTQRT